jgi:phosphoglycolate phosphatase (TIGR01487 family)
MRHTALAADYDGTLAHHGSVDPTTIEALKNLRESGRYLLMVTGRELEDLRSVFSEMGLFHRIVAENGALIFDPSRNEITKTNGNKPPDEFIERLKQKGVSPLSVGHIIVATHEPHEHVVLDAIRDFKLELNVIFNKGSVMILPAGVNKASGLTLALQELGLSLHDVAGIGDAENDSAFLSVCGFSACVANALDPLKKSVDYVTKGAHGAGVQELIRKMLSNDLDDFARKLAR